MSSVDKTTSVSTTVAGQTPVQVQRKRIEPYSVNFDGARKLANEEGTISKVKAAFVGFLELFANLFKVVANQFIKVYNRALVGPEAPKPETTPVALRQPEVVKQIEAPVEAPKQVTVVRLEEEIVVPQKTVEVPVLAERTRKQKLVDGTIYYGSKAARAGLVLAAGAAAGYAAHQGTKAGIDVLRNKYSEPCDTHPMGTKEWRGQARGAAEVLGENLAGTFVGRVASKETLTKVLRAGSTAAPFVAAGVAGLATAKYFHNNGVNHFVAAAKAGARAAQTTASATKQAAKRTAQFVEKHPVATVATLGALAGGAYYLTRPAHLPPFQGPLNNDVCDGRFESAYGTCSLPKDFYAQPRSRAYGNGAA